MSWFQRFINTVRGRTLSQDLDREIAFHLAERSDDLASRGMDTDDATLEARRRFGNRTVHTEQARDRDVLLWLESLLADTRYAIRSLVANPGFTTVAVVSLALGLGANTAIFSLANAVVLRSLPVRDPGQLVLLDIRDKQHAAEAGDPYFTNPIWEEIRDHTHVFSGSFAYANRAFDLANGGIVRRANGAVVSGAFFHVLGVQAVAGRLLDRSDDVRGCGGVAVVSGGFADRELGGAARAVGRTLSLDGHPVPIIGVADPRFFGIEVGRKADVFVPLCMVNVFDGAHALDERSRWYLEVMGRAPGMTPEDVGARLSAASSAIFQATLPSGWSKANQANYLSQMVAAVPGAGGLSELRHQYAHALWLLMAAVAVVLIIACVNIANLLLARGAVRQHEIAIRLSLGAGCGRVIRQLLCESLFLALIGAALGAVFARWADRVIVAWISTRHQPALLDMAIDWRVLGFTIIAALVTAALFGLLPAWRATRVDPQTIMKSGGRGMTGHHRQRLSRPLVAAQLALSLALVTGAGLLLVTFRNLDAVNPGFRREGVYIVQTDFAHAASDTARLPAMERDVLDRLGALPGVRSASQSAFTPMSGAGWNEYILTAGYVVHDARDSLAYFNAVSENFFSTMGTALLSGRTFRAGDNESPVTPAIVTRTMARRFFGVDNPLGRTFRTPVADSTSPPYEIIGVVGDSKYNKLDEQTSPIVYLPLGARSSIQGWTQWNYELRSDLPISSILPAARDAIAAVSPSIELDATTISAQIESTLARPRLLATLSSFFGALALVLAVIGLYGTLAYDVARRRNEIGIRMALGAAWRDVVRLVLGDAGRIIIAGIVVGAVLSLAGSHLVSSLLFGVAPQDLRTLVGAVLVLLCTALIATMLPAWRAARTHPAEALRDE